MYTMCWTQAAQHQADFAFTYELAGKRIMLISVRNTMIPNQTLDMYYY